MSRAERSAKTAFRPAPRLILGTPVHFLAFGFGSGLAPVAPGTFGTLAGLPVWWLLAQLPAQGYLAATAALAVAGCWICGESSRRLGVHDHGGIVWDEIVGLLITAIPLLPLRHGPALPLLAGLAAAFGLFRLFDIWKPWPIRRLDRGVHGGLGIMLDDLVAALYAAVLLAVLLHLLDPGLPPLR